MTRTLQPAKIKSQKTSMTLTNFENCILIAMPSLDDKNFSRSVTYVFSHNEEGTTGIVINQPINLPFETVLKNLNIRQTDVGSKVVHVCRGGPVAPESGFLLHEGGTSVQNDCFRVGSDIYLATSKDFLEAFAKSPLELTGLFAIGHASWGPGQLEEEIRQGFWLCDTADKNIIFKAPFEKRWNMAFQQMGIDLSNISPDIGHA